VDREIGIDSKGGMAEREGFEPPIPVKVCLISSQVHSTALPSLRVFVFRCLRCLLLLLSFAYDIDYDIASSIYEFFHLSSWCW
jgi:hypothetical protein